MKEIIKRLFAGLGYNISRIPKISGPLTPYSDIDLGPNRRVVDLEKLAQLSLAIPGMVTPRSGQLLYAMCYLQELTGDVVEIGSWQGRSTSFLARAVANSGNGRLYAIDHFRGNVGKERAYVVSSKDLSDLKAGFLANMKTLGLIDHIKLLDVPSEQAVERMSDVKIRFLFIDGDHTRAGVEKDIELFFPKLMKGSIVVFDDFSKDAPGVVEAISALLSKQELSRIMSYQNTLVLVV